MEEQEDEFREEIAEAEQDEPEMEEPYTEKAERAVTHIGNYNLKDRLNELIDVPISNLNFDRKLQPYKSILQMLDGNVKSNMMKATTILHAVKKAEDNPDVKGKDWKDDFWWNYGVLPLKELNNNQQETNALYSWQVEFLKHMVNKLMDVMDNLKEDSIELEIAKQKTIQMQTEKTDSQKTIDKLLNEVTQRNRPDEIESLKKEIEMLKNKDKQEEPRVEPVPVQRPVDIPKKEATLTGEEYFESVKPKLMDIIKSGMMKTYGFTYAGRKDYQNLPDTEKKKVKVLADEMKKRMT